MRLDSLILILFVWTAFVPSTFAERRHSKESSNKIHDKKARNPASGKKNRPTNTDFRKMEQALESLENINASTPKNSEGAQLPSFPRP